ncbi:aminoacyl-tRNA hydrolase [Paracoccus sp. MC1862]|uniref:aminoacyl-tRNA hydrolase n=1 Tax=Paracoccus sp. MC1862 TaxID=2760307 RepID=UPI0015FEC77A|nr:aminoacyl-tRNA hydrolase [Paracoccus sp. MC1862]MBB1497793.1 aminoacyl-tRNA hydrolase [Paracoccus sp. MC1862]QQO45276.1 aminoacyl-tRNA hydrolase [Paracoccus sp. MC1862]
MLLMVGLGNPGAKYAGNRHNIGFMAVDRIAVDHGFSPWKSRFQGLVAEGRLGEQRVTALKPQSFMNLSGQSVGEAMRYLKLTPAEVLVLHDELDLAPGTCRLKTGGGHAGHNGLRSIHQHIGEDYRRLRVGIGHPGHKDKVSGYVLSDFAKAEEAMLDDLLRGISDGAEALARGDGAAFGTALAARVALAPQKPSRPVEKPAEAGTKPDLQPLGMADRLRALGNRFR